MEGESLFAGSSLCVVGNLNRDIKTSAVPAGQHLLHDGETPVACVTETIGGGGANSVCTAAALGARAAFLGKVGLDSLGNRLERTLQKHGISTHLARDPEHSSGCSIAIAFDSGQRHFISCLPANEALSFSDLDLAAFDFQGFPIQHCPCQTAAGPDTVKIMAVWQPGQTDKLFAGRSFG